MSNYVIHYNGRSIQTQAPVGSLTNDQILTQSVTQWPELAGSTVNVTPEGIVTFNRPVGTKQ